MPVPAPSSEDLLEKMIYLPIYPQIPDSEIQRTAKVLAFEKLVGAEGFEPSNGGIKIR